MGDLQYEEFILPHQFGEHLGGPNGLDPWFARFAGRRSDEVAQLLRTDWDQIEFPAVAGFRDALLAFKPISLIQCDDERDLGFYKGWWLRMKGPPNRQDWNTEVFLTAPPDRAALQELIARYGFPESEGVTEFCWYFYQMHNAVDGSATGFNPPPWMSLDDGGFYDDASDPDHFDPDRKWADACQFYHTDCGECVLLNKDGEVGWYLSAEVRIRPMARSFSEFLEQCALCYRVDGILNYYSSWDDHFQ